MSVLREFCLITELEIHLLINKHLMNVMLEIILDNMQCIGFCDLLRRKINCLSTFLCPIITHLKRLTKLKAVFRSITV